MNRTFHARPVIPQDAAEISKLLQNRKLVHRHLDWRTPIDWLGQQPFWLLKDDQRVCAALACQEDPPGTAWIRFFSILPDINPDKAFELLLKNVLDDFSNKEIPTIISVVLQEWYLHTLMSNGFEYLQDIVVLLFDQHFINKRKIDPEFILREMTRDDLEDVLQLDQSCFEPVWQYSMDNIKVAFQLCSYSTVLEYNGKIIGYQMSSSTIHNAHLARLAVHPSIQRKGIGYALVQDLLEYFQNLGLQLITVNTQSNNQPSLSLYKNIGFKLSKEKYPVMVFKGRENSTLNT